MAAKPESTAGQELDPTWGYASSDVYTQRWALIEPHLTRPRFVLVDWGSDAGWFSVTAAEAFPDATVVSVEAGIMTQGAGLRVHRQAIAARGVENNQIVDALFGPPTFEGLAGVPADYQLVLSVFHHMGDGFGRYLTTVAEWDAAFCDLIRGAGVTFFQVPNETSKRETPHRVRSWYDGRDVETTIRAALERGGVNATVELLGSVEHGAKGSRDLFKIALATPPEAASPDAIIEHVKAASRAAAPRLARRVKLAVGDLLRKLGVRR